MPRERNLERLLNEEKLPNFYHDVNATNFIIYVKLTLMTLILIPYMIFLVMDYLVQIFKENI